MALTENQQYIHNTIIDNIIAGTKRIKLIGSAGVGKTYLVGELVKTLAKMTDKNIFVTAPTNKALAVLMGKIDGKISDNIKFYTIHSALNLKRNINSKTGKVSFVKSDFINMYKPQLANCYVCFIDEVSMLNSVILDFIDSYNIPIIFIGDDKQLNPIGENVSPIWNRDYLTFRLTEIIRQGKLNPIIELSNDLGLIPFKRDTIINGEGYRYHNKLNNSVEELAEVNGTDDLKYLSWSNDDVNRMNSYVRNRLYGNPKKVENGETLIFNSPLDYYYTNQEVLVNTSDVVSDFINVPNSKTNLRVKNKKISFDRIKLKYYFVNEDFMVIHEDSQQIYNEILKQLRFNCVKLGWSWVNYYWFVEQFADIKYNHAITVHKS